MSVYCVSKVQRMGTGKIEKKKKNQLNFVRDQTSIPFRQNQYGHCENDKKKKNNRKTSWSIVVFSVSASRQSGGFFFLYIYCCLYILYCFRRIKRSTSTIPFNLSSNDVNRKKKKKSTTLTARLSVYNIGIITYR